MTESLFAGIDLHSNNLMIGIVDQDGQRLSTRNWIATSNSERGWPKSPEN